jgi:hypothetical protein
MKRVQKNERQVRRTGDVEKDFTKGQLAGIGRVTLAYNEIELWIHLLFSAALGLDLDLGHHVSTRINGIDGIVEVIKTWLKHLGCPETPWHGICQILGEQEFQLLKKYRDAIIHARMQDVPAGIGVTPGKRGKREEILLTESALDGVYRRLAMMRREFPEISKIAITLRVFRDQTPSLFEMQFLSEDYKEKSWQRVLEEAQASWTQIQEHRKQRLALPPLPEFPEELNAPLSISASEKSSD